MPEMSGNEKWLREYQMLLDQMAADYKKFNKSIKPYIDILKRMHDARHANNKSIIFNTASISPVLLDSDGLASEQTDMAYFKVKYPRYVSAMSAQEFFQDFRKTLAGKFSSAVQFVQLDNNEDLLMIGFNASNEDLKKLDRWCQSQEDFSKDLKRGKRFVDYAGVLAEAAQDIDANTSTGSYEQQRESFLEHVTRFSEQQSLGPARP